MLHSSKIAEVSKSSFRNIGQSSTEDIDIENLCVWDYTLLSETLFSHELSCYMPVTL